MLQKSLMPEHHIKRLAKFKWTTQKEAANSFVLPDCVAVEFAGGECRPCALWDDNDPDGVILPLAHDLLVVGRAKDDWSPPTDAVRQLIGCSTRFYFAPTNRWQGESASIGKLVRQVVEKTIVSSHAKSKIGKLGFPMDIQAILPK